MDGEYYTTIGMDVSDRTTKVCVMAKERGARRIIEETTIPTTGDALRAYLSGKSSDWPVVFETGTHCRWMKREVESLDAAMQRTRLPHGSIVTLREEPKEAVKRSTITMMIGNTTQEANLFLENYPDFILPVATKLIHLKVPGGRGSYKQRACDALTTHIYVRPQLEILKEYQGTAYRYVYNHPLPASHQGCFHACELPILFGTKMMGADGALDPFGQSLRAIWGKFAKDSNPGWTRGHVRVIE